MGKNLKPLMIMGTASHVGKSLVVTAFCRIFSRKYRVAPFKAQNMSLNSWITKDGKEIGIAQAIQAKAANIEPSADMNPVLLKPKGNHISQVVILGKPCFDKKAGEYYDSIDEMLFIVENAYKRLSSKYELIIIEGAGGAAEINLYHRDIVNIGIARIVKPKIILIGDIERGGVFASIYGTLQLLPQDIRKLVSGIIINKFRGDIQILEPGIKQLEEITQIPVLGVIPYTDIKIPSEDSVSINDKVQNNHPIKIAIIKFPHISNFTDFEVLEKYADIRYIELDDRIKDIDAVILPGTKNTIDDLKKLKKSKLYDDIISCSKKGIPIIGICGGYQMLGKEVIDKGIESENNETIKALGLLPISTEFSAYSKYTKQVEKKVTGKGRILSSINGETVKGYEIHMGKTYGSNNAFEDDGCENENGLVIGTYLHGLFENENIRDAFLKYLYSRKNLEYVKKNTDDNIDKLAEFIENNVNMDLLGI